MSNALKKTHLCNDKSALLDVAFSMIQRMCIRCESLHNNNCKSVTSLKLLPESIRVSWLFMNGMWGKSKKFSHDFSFHSYGTYAATFFEHFLLTIIFIDLFLHNKNDNHLPYPIPLCSLSTEWNSEFDFFFFSIYE